MTWFSTRGSSMLLLASASLALTTTTAAAATLPSGFSESLVAGGLASPTAMAFAPDGRLFVAEQGGRLRVVKNGSLLSQSFVSLTVSSAGERGLLGVTFDPNFATNRYVYVYYTATSPAVHNRVSRFTANGDVAVAGSEVVILDLNNLSTATNHNGGAIHFGADGKLYVAAGENATASNAQTLGNVLGKILRINKDGTIPTDNPFYTTATGVNRAIWARGLRNPFTFAVQPGTGRIYINDVGESAWEEVNEGVAGANYGWPNTEGPTTNPEYRTPLHAYQHGSSSSTGCAIAGGTFYNPSTTQFPTDYTGDYLFADHCSGWIRRYDPATRSVSGFAAGTSRPVDLKVGTDGKLYYLARGTGSTTGVVFRVAFSNTQAPSISVHPVSQTVPAGNPVTFTASASGATPLSYQWQRNGVNISGATSASYTISSVTTTDNGASFRVRVTNAYGTATSNDAILTVTAPNTRPTGTITAPLNGTLYSGGQTVNYSATGTDLEDGTLPASAFTWEVVFHHDTHTHPFIPPTTGSKSGSFVVLTTGHTETNVWYRIHLTVKDSANLTHSSFVDIVPRKVTLQVQTSPAGLQVTLDGQPRVSPVSTQSVVGVQRQIGAPTPQTVGGITYGFTSWSDGGAATHTISTPPTSTTYTASYTAGPTSGGTGLVVAYKFDEGSGTTAADSSGNGRTATLVNGTTWVAGKFGVAVATDGVNDYVETGSTANLPRWTISAWVKSPASPADGPPSGPIHREANYQINWNHHIAASRGMVRVKVGGVWHGAAFGPLAANTWYYLAATYDGETLKAYTNGILVASDTSPSGSADADPNSLKLGRHAAFAQYFRGTIDNVRIYNRALTAAEVQADMNLSVGGSTADATPPAVTITSPTSGSTYLATSSPLTLGGSASDNVGVTQVSWTSDRGGSGTASGTSSWSASGITLQSGTNVITVTARDAAGNAATDTLTVTFSPPGPAPTGLVAAYGFDEGSGTTAADASGKGNTGTLSGPAWTTQGKFGNALRFDGINDLVVVGSSASLNLSTGMTLEAWVYPTAAQSGWRTIVQREVNAYYLHASHSGGALHPAGRASVSSTSGYLTAPTAISVNTWTHLAVTYDGTAIRLYVNGVAVASKPQTGSIQSSSKPLRIGGNSPYGEYFQGRIDNVRIYNRALTASEIQADMSTPVGAAPSSTQSTQTTSSTSTASTSSPSTAGVAATGTSLLVAGAGAGDQPRVRVFAAGRAFAEFFAYDLSLRGGVFVTVGNLVGLGDPQVVTGPGPGGRPLVRAFWPDGSDFGLSVAAYEDSFTGGVRVATCDLDGDGRAEIITGPGPGRAPLIRVWKVEATMARETASFLAAHSSVTRGVFVACGDVNGDGRLEIVSGLDAGGRPDVRVWNVSGTSATELIGFVAYPLSFTGGVRVATADVDGDGRAEVVTGAGPGGAAEVRVYRIGGTAASTLASFPAAGAGFTGGVFVAGGDVDGGGGMEVVAGADATVRVFSISGSAVTQVTALPPADATARPDVSVGAGP